ncbi:hypothetical protein BaRGS_00028703 [Batillaria attramentaria]|uniref:Leucine-rich repeat and WD repeat-containing protein 1 WD domain-containing protein n=1 Tax=Batillaria attramentaria TaxID=370345 RepID=A0ABD0JYE3_9CAEN
MKQKRRSTAGASPLTQVLDRLPDVPSYEPKDFLCCHGDLGQKTKVWACAFEPSIDAPGETHNILATCGGDTVCFIDVTTGITMKRYKDTERGESFYTMAWTSLEGDGKKVNILAVAGEGSSVKLIYPDQLVLYSVIQGHKKYISCLAFHPASPRLLLSGSRDGHIKLWDIGTPDLKGSSNHMPLLRIKVPQHVGDPLSMVISNETGMLVAATECGCVGWRLPEVTKLCDAASHNKVIERPSVSFALPLSGSSMETIDSLVALDHGLVATKRVDSGEIVVWDLDKHIRSAGSKHEVQVKALVRLKFPDTSVKYLNMGYCAGMLGVGDDAGKIHLYDLSTVNSSSAPTHLTWLPPSRVVDWPDVDYKDKMEVDGDDTIDSATEPVVVVNTVAISSDHKYIAGGTDNNLVCVWQQEGAS